MAMQSFLISYIIVMIRIDLFNVGNVKYMASISI